LATNAWLSELNLVISTAMQIKIILLSGLIAIANCACSKNDSPSANDGSPKPASEVKIKIGLNGEVHENGKVLSQEEFLQELQRLKAANIGVIYSRENAEKDPTAAQSDVISILQESGIPARYSKN
jgi:hypothetical protein